jgi:putative ABC transport system ATP-binding protein
MFYLQNLSHQYANGKTMAFRDWNAAQGEQWLLTGTSGSGKTTLLQIISGLLRPSAGEVSLAGTEIYRLRGAAADRFRGKNIGLVLQKPHLLASLSVLDNLRLTQYLAGIREDKNRIREVLNALQLTDKEKVMTDTLSQGEAQRVAIARAVLNQPKLLLADEPTASLDDVNAEKVVELLQQQAIRTQATLVIATHDSRVKSHFKLQYALSSYEL